MRLQDKVAEMPKHLTTKQVAAMLGTTPAAVREYARRAGVTFSRGKTMSKAKITELEAEAIRSDYRPLAEIAADYGISKAQCCRIRGGMHWSVANIATNEYRE